jgi:hypothetical protein
MLCGVRLTFPGSKVAMESLPPGVVDRPYFSSWLLWAAEHEADLARQIEQRRDPGQYFPWPEHRALVLSSVLASATFLEAMVNELYQDVAEGYDHFGVTAPLSEEVRVRMRDLWERTDGGRRASTLEKYESLVALDHNASPYVEANILMQLRNAIVHYRPKDGYTAKQARSLEGQLKGRFEPNPIQGNITRAWWPEHALGSGCAIWAHQSAAALAGHVSAALGIAPDYARHKSGSWFDLRPGESELIHGGDRLRSRHKE